LDTEQVIVTINMEWLSIPSPILKMKSGWPSLCVHCRYRFTTHDIAFSILYWHFQRPPVPLSPVSETTNHALHFKDLGLIPGCYMWSLCGEFLFKCSLLLWCSPHHALLHPEMMSLVTLNYQFCVHGTLETQILYSTWWLVTFSTPHKQCHCMFAFFINLSMTLDFQLHSHILVTDSMMDMLLDVFPLFTLFFIFYLIFHNI
jgi:hypothetical protein